MILSPYNNVKSADLLISTFCLFLFQGFDLLGDGAVGGVGAVAVAAADVQLVVKDFYDHHAALVDLAAVARETVFFIFHRNPP